MPLRSPGPGAAGQPVIVFDTETTGCTGTDRVVSLGAVRLDAALEPEATLHLVFAPGIRCHFGAFRVHGLSDAYLARQPGFAEHAEEVAGFFGGALGCAHNMSFDRRMLGAEFDRLDMPRPWSGEFCTMLAWRRQRPREKSGLAHASAACGLARETALHGALEDAWLAANLLRALHGLPPAPMRLHGFTNDRAGDMAA
ncbi:3'-5' exonuclease [Muricoccus pecuniae]|uniref:DNA polymerase-3 subunit epsilon n=1 Tax=Muricoccus pecuniae TaxID=693023 RepID=A0A840YJP2_9PROT|nr:3'-5' exonuclease [Roseomonas pecuniae]MBB5694244.1 DNA polymerase-3 subunit epsilon [Roseomonas pecuniae]